MNLRRLTWLVLLAALLGACGTVAEPETSLAPQASVAGLTVVNKGGNSTWKYGGNFLSWTPTGSGNAVATAYAGETLTVGAYGRGGYWEGCDSTRDSLDPKHYCTVKLPQVQSRTISAGQDRTITFVVNGFVIFKTSITTMNFTVEGNGRKSYHVRDELISLPAGTYKLSGSGYNSSCNCALKVSASTTFTVERGKTKAINVSVTRN